MAQSQSKPPPLPNAHTPAWHWLRMWRAGQADDVRRFLEDQDALSLGGRVAVLLVEQRERWQAGERIQAETMFSWFPDLQAQAEAAVELIYGEYLLRRHVGETPTLEEYQQRFPAYADWLARQFALHQALQASGAPSTETLDHLSASQSASNVETGPSTPSKDRASAARQFGRYEVQAILGKGGMGVAYRAWDPRLKRVVVLKTLRAADADAHELGRFRAEAEAVAQIRHPNVVQVFDVGEQEGQPFIAMEFCEGGSLANRLKGTPLPPREAARLIEQIGQGIAAAHALNIIHRDLKPANVLLREADGGKSAQDKDTHPLALTSAAAGTPPSNSSPSRSLADFVVKVGDFGLAKKLDAHDDQTRTGAILGTPSYMSPEQAFGASKHVGPGADIYSLGAILYECLTGRPPFAGTTVADTLDQVRRRDPVPVRHLQPATPVDLETIALKCLHKEPAKRYTTADAVLDDLNRFLDGRPILARPVGPAGRAWRWCRRNPLTAALLSAVFVVLVSGIAATTGMWLRAQANYDQSEINRIQAKNNHAAAERNFLTAFKAVEDSFAKISEDRLLHLPGMQGLRKELMPAARPFYEDFVRQRGGDRAMRRNLGVALANLADIEAQSGSPDKAIELWKEALALVQELERDKPGGSDYPQQRVRALKAQGGLLATQNRLADARKTLEVAAEQAAKLSASHPKNWTFVCYEATCWEELSSVVASEGDFKHAETLMRRALAVTMKLRDIDPDRPDVLNHVGHAHFCLGQMLLSSRQFPAAAAELEAARKTLTTATQKSFRDQPVARYSLARTLGILGSAYSKLQRPDDAEKSFLAAQTLLEQFARESPTMKTYRHSCTVNEHNLAILYTEQGKFDDAEVRSRKVVAERETLCKEFPSEHSYAWELAASYRLMVNLAARRGQPEEQLRWNAAAIAILSGLMKTHPTLQTKELLIKAAGGRGQTLYKLGKFSEALADLDTAIEHAVDPLRQSLLAWRAVSRAKSGNWQGAVADADAVPATQDVDDEYDFIRACALSCKLAAQDAALPDATRRQKAEEAAIKAMRRLARLPFAEVPGLRQQLVDDPDLEPLRARPDFQALLAKFPVSAK